jgi:hypothetical protein
MAERSYEEEGSRRRDDAENKIAHETTDALTLSGHARTPSGCKSGDIKRTIIKNRRMLKPTFRILSAHLRHARARDLPGVERVLLADCHRAIDLYV